MGRKRSMKKRIILAVSVLVLLAIAGGGVYWYRLPAKMQEEEDFDAVMTRNVRRYRYLLDQHDLGKMLAFLKEWRSFVLQREQTPKTVYALFVLYPLENAQLRTYKQNEKTLDNIREMEKILSRHAEHKYSEARLLEMKLWIAQEKIEYCRCKGEHKKAYEILQTFITEHGGEAKLKETFSQSATCIFCGSMAACLMELGRLDESAPYIEEEICYSAGEPQNQHCALLHMAELFLKKKEPEKAMEYIRKAHEMYQSRRSYGLFAMAFYQLGRKEEAKKYFSLAVACKKYPYISDNSLMEFKELLLQ